MAGNDNAEGRSGNVEAVGGNTVGLQGVADGRTVADEDAGGWCALASFTGLGGEYFWILFRNLIFSMLTLGVYSFWGKTRSRVYLWSKTALWGEQLEYTGTGKELFFGFLIVLPIFFVGSFLASLLIQVQALVGLIVFYLGFIFLWNFAVYRALRYRLTRTRWRGIRANLEGGAAHYACKATGYTLLMLVSCGLLVPWCSARITELKLNNVWFGNRKVEFAGKAKELYVAYLPFFLAGVAAVLAVSGVILWLEYTQPSSDYGTSYGYMGTDVENQPLLAFIPLVFLLCIALLSVFYQAAWFRWLFRHARFGEMTFRSTLSGWRLMELYVTNALLLLCTFGIGFAWVVTRSVRMHLNSLECRGPLNAATLLQDDKPAPARGEGLLEALDADIGF